VPRVGSHKGSLPVLNRFFRRCVDVTWGGGDE
jgi:hypothetical protein